MEMKVEVELEVEVKRSTLSSTSGTNMSADRKRVGRGRRGGGVMRGHGVEVVFPLTDSL